MEPLSQVRLDQALGEKEYRKQLKKCRKELAELLNLPPAQCTALLRRMVDRGELLLTGKRYALPPQKKPPETN